MAGTIITDRIESDATYDSKIELVSPVLVSNTFSVKSTGGTGNFNIVGANTNTDRTLTLPDNSGTVLTSASNLAGVTGVGKVLQVVSVTTTDMSTTTSASFVTTGFFASITPTSATSKVLIISNANGDNDLANKQISLTVFRGATNIGSTNGLLNVYSPAGRIIAPTGINFLDSPATTSPTTYTIFFASTNAAGAVNYNVGNGSGNQTAVLTLMEIAA